MFSKLKQMLKGKRSSLKKTSALKKSNYSHEELMILTNDSIRDIAIQLISEDNRFDMSSFNKDNFDFTVTERGSRGNDESFKRVTMEFNGKYRYVPKGGFHIHKCIINLFEDEPVIIFETYPRLCHGDTEVDINEISSLFLHTSGGSGEAIALIKKAIEKEGIYQQNLEPYITIFEHDDHYEIRTFHHYGFKVRKESGEMFDWWHEDPMPMVDDFSG